MKKIEMSIADFQINEITFWNSGRSFSMSILMQTPPQFHLPFNLKINFRAEKEVNLLEETFTKISVTFQPWPAYRSSVRCIQTNDFIETSNFPGEAANGQACLPVACRKEIWHATKRKDVMQSVREPFNKQTFRDGTKDASRIETSRRVDKGWLGWKISKERPRCFVVFGGEK